MAKRTASARKQARSGERRTIRNRSVRSAVKTRVTRVRRALTEGADNVEQLAVSAISGLDRAASKGVLHANNAARRKSRLMKAIAAAVDKSEVPAAEKKPAKKAAAAAKKSPAAAKKAPAKKPAKK